MHRPREGETVRMLRVPPADRADATDTEEIPRYDEEGDMEDNWGKATGRVPDEPDPMHFEGLPTTHSQKYLTPDEIKQRNIALMTAATMWFFLVCVLAVVGSFVLKLIGHILGG